MVNLYDKYNSKSGVCYSAVASHYHTCANLFCNDLFGDLHFEIQRYMLCMYIALHSNDSFFSHTLFSISWSGNKKINSKKLLYWSSVTFLRWTHVLNKYFITIMKFHSEISTMFTSSFVFYIPVILISLWNHFLLIDYF